MFLDRLDIEATGIEATAVPVDPVGVVGMLGIIDGIEESIEARNAATVLGRASPGTVDQSR